MEKNLNNPYGFELILDLHSCDVDKFNRKSLDYYFKKICKAIGMVRCERYFWDDVGVPCEERQSLPHTKGTSAVQFILTSNIVIHTLDELASVYVNIFSCKKFDEKLAEQITIEWFGAKNSKAHFIERV
jgi:S-adenosylmethionine/arginine decarboxylase-like enzyme